MTTTSIKSTLEAAANPDTNFKLWLDELTMAQKWLKPWWDNARRASDRYVNKDSNNSYGAISYIGPARGRRYNIFGANVDVLSAALYATPPNVAVSRKFDDYEDDVARVGATIIQRVIEQDLLDYTNNFHAVCNQVVQDRLVPGMGTAWLLIEMDATGQIPSVKIEHVQWADFIYSPCDTWENRRWVARRVVMTYDVGVLRFGDVFKNVPPTCEKPTAGEQDVLGTPVVQEAEVYEIWDRLSKKVMWMNPSYPTFLDVKDDYLNIKNFEPCPKPFFATLLNEVCRPLPDFIRWFEQYTELDEINQRISMLVKACKAVGVYDKAQKGVQRLMQEGTDNTLIPVDDWAMFAEKGGLKGTIDWLPLETIVAAQDTLRSAREDVKAQIYELTGISDVVRGTSNPHETLGAQKLKADYASSRIQVIQGDFEAWVTHVLTIKAEMAVMQFPSEMLIQQSNIMNTPDRDLAQEAVAALKSGDFFNFRIIIEPLSMAQIDYTQEKTDRLEFASTMGTFLEKAVAAAEKSPDLIPMMAAMIQFVVAGFRVSSTIEGTIDKTLQNMVAKQKAAEENPEPPKPSPEEIKAQSAQMMAQQKAQLEMQKFQMQMEKDKQTNALEMLKMQQEMEMQQAESELKIVEMQAKIQQDRERNDLEIAKLEVELQLAQQQAEVEIATSVMQAETARMQEENNLIKQGADIEHQQVQRAHDGVMMNMQHDHECEMMDKESEAEAEDNNESGEE